MLHKITTNHRRCLTVEDMTDTRLNFIDEGNGPAIVFVHGTPSSSQEFRGVIDQLKKSYRCIAIDHLGFGKSPKPADGDYSLQAHSQRLGALLTLLGLRSFHLVVTDFGGPIALPVAFERWDQVQSLVVLNSWAWPLEDVDPKIKKMKKIMLSPLMKFLYLHLNFSANVMVKSAWGKYSKLTRQKHAQYKAAFPSANDRHGTWAFLNALFDRNNPAWQTGERLSRLEAKPTLILWGQADVLPQDNIRLWRNCVPTALVKMLPKVGHFVCDEAPELVAPLLIEFYRKI